MTERVCSRSCFDSWVSFVDLILGHHVILGEGVVLSQPLIPIVFLLFQVNAFFKLSTSQACLQKGLLFGILTLDVPPKLVIELC